MGSMASPLPDDPALPATVHLAGAGATPILAAAVESAGGRLITANANHIQYRPGADAVVRFDASVSWSDGPAQRETLVAATGLDGAPAGTLPVSARVGGRDLSVGVWRWPFDPVLGALTSMVTPPSAAAMLGSVVDGPVELRVVAYRPTERAVIRVVDRHGAALYVKVLPAESVAALVERHRLLRAGGIPVPEVVAAGEGWMAMTELAGPTLRDLMKGTAGAWPAADEFGRLFEALRAVELPERTASTRTADGLGHAAMLATIAPELQPALDRITTVLRPAAERSTARAGTVHGDLHEAQVVVADGSITGLLDVDDAGRGDPLDDLATLIAHTRFRAIVADDAGRGIRLGGYAEALTTAFSRQPGRVDAERGELELVVAAVMLGLATGPFRVQRPGWHEEVRSIVALAEQLSGTAGVVG